ncbi:MAG: hypothetical protein ABI687_02220 [Flavitalea sp.]
MANKKKTSKTLAPEKTLFEKISEQAAHLKDELIAGKDHLVEAAGEKIASVKSTIKEYQARKKAVVKKVAVKKKQVKKTVKKAVKKAAKKVAAIPVKKKIAAVVKKVVQKKAVVKKKKAARKK